MAQKSQRGAENMNNSTSHTWKIETMQKITKAGACFGITTYAKNKYNDLTLEKSETLSDDAILLTMRMLRGDKQRIMLLANEIESINV